MFVIVNNNQVILGPKKWNKLHFEEVLKEDLEIDYSLPTKNDDLIPFVINETTSILPVKGISEPDHNSKIQRLDGPYWNFTSNHAEMSYQVVNLPLEAIRNRLKEVVANNRYITEISGIKVNIQGQEVTVDTARGSRDIFLQTALMMNDTETINWKFPEAWIAVTKADISACVNAGKQHIQVCFDWEAQKNQEIDNAQTHEQLDAIILDIESK